MNPRRKEHYFETSAGAPEPIRAEAFHRIAFGETDPLRIAWHGNFPRFFELAWTALSEKTRLTPEAFERAGTAAPVVQLHTDYRRPLKLGERVRIAAEQVWDDGARMNIEYRIEGPDGSLRATGYTVQMIVGLDTGEPLFCDPEFFAEFRERWKNGEFHD